MVGDIVRRLVARTIAQQMSDAVEAATAPYQCIALALQLLTEENLRYSPEHGRHWRVRLDLSEVDA